MSIAGFFRISELLDVQIKDITIHSNYIEVYVKKSKCDQLREGHVVKIAETKSSTCPVFWLKKYLRVTNLENHPESYLLCKFYKTRKSHRVDFCKNVTYDTMRKSFLMLISKVFPGQCKQFGLHSLRSGGASAAADNEVDERLIGKHGRWKSKRCQERYIKDGNPKRLSVSKSLGI